MACAVHYVLPLPVILSLSLSDMHIYWYYTLNTHTHAHSLTDILELDKLQLQQLQSGSNRVNLPRGFSAL